MLCDDDQRRRCGKGGVVPTGVNNEGHPLVEGYVRSLKAAEHAF